MQVSIVTSEKSTVVKALLSVLDFIHTMVFSDSGESLSNIRFYFNKSYFSHIGTFKRAIYNKAPEGSAIVFEFGFGDFFCEVSVEGAIDDDESISGQVAAIKLTRLDFNIDLNFLFKSGVNRISAVFHSQRNPLCKNVFSKEEQKIINGYFDGFDCDVEMEMPIVTGRIVGGAVLDLLYDGFIQQFNKTLEFYTSAGSSQSSDIREGVVQGLSPQMISHLNNKKKYFKSSLFRYVPHGAIIIGAPRTEYIYAHAVTQTVIYSAKDINDYYVKTIHEFANQRMGTSGL